MTISYSGNFIQLLCRWKASIWRTVWKELIVYICLYYLIRIFYLLGINLIAHGDDANKLRLNFEAMCRTFDNYCKLIPLTFLLGFYVSNVVNRWWHQFEALVWPEDIISHVCATIKGQDEKSQKRRHQIARYVNLSAALAWRDISQKIRLRFPTIDSIVQAGLLTEKEHQMLEDIHNSCESLRWQTPLYWAGQLMGVEEEENKPVTSMLSVYANELKAFRNSLRKLYTNDWVTVPLVYTQVATLATYAFFFFALFGRQPLGPDMISGKDFDTYIPVFLIVQYLFFVGWYKVGLDLMRPFGLDDDDFELNYILDRNILTSFTLTSRLAISPPPPFEDDIFWKNREGRVEPLPHSIHSKKLKEHHPKLHAYVNIEKEKEGKGCRKGDRKKKHINW